MMVDYCIVGAGLSGATYARLVAEKGAQVLLVEKRNHLAGNTYDEVNEAGIMVHHYGPHIFHTQHQYVWEFLSRFTKWREYEHKVKAFVQGKLLPFPINVDTINLLYGTSFTPQNIEEEFFTKLKTTNANITSSRDVVVSQVGEELYELFFKNYTLKQWGIPAEELDKEVAGRIPVRYNWDDRYFTDTYQGMPRQGYTQLVRNMLAHSNIQLLLNTDYETIKTQIDYGQLIYTGPIDSYFNFRYGQLPYRSLRFEFATLPVEYFQSVAVVNYPNDFEYTRITEFKHLTGQKGNNTTIVKEYPVAEGEPYYPIPQAENRKIYEKYAADASRLEKVHFLGRLGLYKYANMDIVVKDALELFKKLS
jgi:UDP-galactopyranose mutase